MRSRLLELSGLESLDALRAIASGTRLKILTLLADGDKNINELATVLGLAQPSVTRHIGMLEEAGLIEAEMLPGTQGQQKRCHLRYDRFLFQLDDAQPPLLRVEEVEMPIGMYTLAHATAPCGLATRDRMIWWDDDPQAFFHPERGSAQILWMSDGFLEYIFPNTLPTATEIRRLDFLAEVCSETTNYNNDFPSDITLWINGVEVGMWTSPGDMGGKRGRLNPGWWNDHNTQYGFLTQWSVDGSGSYVNGVPVSGPRLTDLLLRPLQPITVRLGIKTDAANAGGFNLFGHAFGNHDQDIILNLHYVAAPQTGDKENSRPPESRRGQPAKDGSEAAKTQIEA